MVLVWQDGVLRPAGTPGGEKKKRVQKEKAKPQHADAPAKKRTAEAMGAAEAVVPKRLRGDGDSAKVVDMEGALAQSGLKEGKRGKGAAKKQVRQRPSAYGVKALKGKRAKGALGFKM